MSKVIEAWLEVIDGNPLLVLQMADGQELVEPQDEESFKAWQAHLEVRTVA